MLVGSSLSAQEFTLASPDAIESVKMLNGESLPFENTKDSVKFTIPATAWQPIDTIVELTQ